MSEARDLLEQWPRRCIVPQRSPQLVQTLTRPGVRGGARAARERGGVIFTSWDETFERILLEWFGLWSQVAQVAADVQAEAIYGPCALCWGMGV